nr:hypothetical protein TnSNPV_57 [Trichoplusia ni single nucleopolyhedrovirus]
MNSRETVRAVATVRAVDDHHVGSKDDAILRQPDVCHPIRGHRLRLSSKVIVDMMQYCVSRMRLRPSSEVIDTHAVSNVTG